LLAGDDLEDLAAQQCHALPSAENALSLGTNRKARAGTGECDAHGVGGDFEGRSAEQNLERRAAREIADERVGQSQTEPVECP